MGFHETRTDAQIAAGCCPVLLLDGMAHQTNATGSACPENGVRAESSANFRSGNLFDSRQAGLLTLSYNSIDTNDGPLGRRWTHD